MRVILALVAFLAFSHAAFAQESLALRSAIVAQGSAVTLADAFENAGNEGARAFAVAPAPGESRAVPVSALVSAVRAAGLDWSAPAGLREIVVTRNGATRATAGSVMRRAERTEGAAVRRGDTITLSYSAPGVQLTARARALEDGAVGETIRVQNIQSERETDARVTGAGQAAAGVS